VTSLRAILLRNTLTVFNALNAVVVGSLAVAWWYTKDQRLLLDSLGVCTVIFSNMAVGIVQEWRAHRAARAATIVLDTELSVNRNGTTIAIRRSELRVDDVVALRRGDVVPADGVVLSSDALEVDASILTGESAPHRAVVGSDVFAGAACVAGRGTLRVLHPAGEGLADRINASTHRSVLRSSPMQRKINVLFEWSFGIAVVLAIADVLLSNGEAFDVDRIRRIATLVLGLIPEGLVFFTTITLTLGVLRLAKYGIVVQHLPAVETFASVTAVCMDKTGTLTENRLRVATIVPWDTKQSPEYVQNLISHYALACADDGQTIEAIRAALPTQGTPAQTESTIPFSSSRGFGALRVSASQPWAVLGSPNQLLSTTEQGALEERLQAAGIASMRTVLFAHAQRVDNDAAFDLVPVAIIALADTVRPQAKELVEYFHQSGVELHVCTGDAPEHVVALFAQASVSVPAENIHARMKPHDKRHFVESLQASGHHVAMVGDGVNDLPALTQADVGIAVDGAHSMATLVSDIAFTQPAFHSVPDLVEQGRAIMRTILNVARLFIGKNVVLLLISAMAASGALTYPLTPRRGALLSVLGVGIPAVVLAARGFNTHVIASFPRELFAYIARLAVAVSASVACVAFLNVLHAHPEALFCTIVVSVVVSSMFVDRRDAKGTKHLAAWAVGLIAMWIGLMLWTHAPMPVAILQTFYELPLLSPAELLPLLPSIGLAAVVTLLVHLVPLRLPPRV